MKHYIISIFAAACLGVSSLAHAITVDINFNSLPQGDIGVNDAVIINEFTTLVAGNFELISIGPDMFSTGVTSISSAGGIAFFTFDTSLVNVTSISLGGNSNNATVSIDIFDSTDNPLSETFVTDTLWTEIATLTSTSPIASFSVNLLESEITSMSFTYTNADPGNGGVSPVPVPASIWLFGTGLIGLIGTLRRKRT